MREPSPGLDSIAVEASSPDRQIRARFAGAGDVEVRFAHGAYRRYTERDLGHQLAGLATLLWTGHRQEYLRRVGAASGTPAHRVSPRGKRADFRNALADVAVEGVSPDRSTTVRSVGLLRWEVVVSDGTVRRLAEQEFVAGLLAAVSATLAAYFAAAHRLKDEIFDLRLHEAYADSRWR